MKLSLKARVIIAVCSIVAIVLAVNAVIHVRMFEIEFLDTQRLRTQALVQGMTEEVTHLATTLDGMAGSLQRHCDRITQLNQKDGLIHIAVILRTGKLISHSNVPLGQAVIDEVVRSRLNTQDIVTIDDGHVFHTLIPLGGPGSKTDAVIDVGWLRSGYVRAVHDILNFSVGMFVLSLLVASGITSLLLNKVFNQLGVVVQDLRESKIFTQGILDTIPSQIAVVNEVGVIVAINQAWLQFSIDNSPNHSTQPTERTGVGTSYLDICCSQIEDVSSDVASQGIRDVLAHRLPAFQMEYPCHSPNEHRWFIMTVSWLGHQKPGVVVVHTNITERKLSEEHEKIRNGILKLITQAHPLAFVLEKIALSIEALNPGKLCSILLLDSSGRFLVQGVAPSLPDFYNQAIEGIEIGQGVGSCGTAAFTGKRVIVDDIATHPYWTRFRELAAKAGLASCWSQPIMSATGQVLGTFAIYHREVHTTTANDIVLIDKTSQLAGIAIERSKAAADLQRSEALYRQLTENMKDVVWVLDTDTLRFLYVSPSVWALSGFTPEEIMAEPMDASLMPELQGPIRDLISQHCNDLKSGKITLDTFFTHEIELPCKNGATVWTEIVSHLAYNPESGHIELHGVTRDISERKLFQRELEYHAHIDYLTGVNNRGQFMRLAEQELARTVRYGGDLSNFMVDVDHFKKINDTHGHKSGDLVLKKFAELCLETLRGMDIIGRVGGEEFAVLLPETGVEQALEVAERLREKLASASVATEGGLAIRFTVSIGVTCLKSKNENMDVLLVNADKALYVAKKTGRNKVVLFQDGITNGVIKPYEPCC